MNTMHSKLNLLIFIILSVAFLAQAAFLAVTPVVIDQKAKARDILKESVTLANNTGRKLNVYTFVNNIAAKEGQQAFLDPSQADKTTSLANWIEISRGVIEMQPGEQRKIDFIIHVNSSARPGIYHAAIAFAEGRNRPEAERKVSSNQGFTWPAVTVNLEVIEDVKEYLRLKKFVSDNVFFSGFPVSFSYILENTGNRTVVPSGEVRIYNRRGEELASINVNDDGVPIEPDLARELASLWQGPEVARNLASVVQITKGFGRYKALLDLRYGTEQRGTIQDTVFFWVMPWQKIVIVFGTLLLVVLLATYFLHRSYNKSTSYHEYAASTRQGRPRTRASSVRGRPEATQRVVDLRQPHE